MRLLRRAIPCTLVVLTLTVAPGHAASDPKLGGGNPIARVLQDVARSTATPPAFLDAYDSPDPAARQATVSKASDGDVSTAVAVAADDAYSVPADQPTLLNPDVSANDTGSPSMTLVMASPSHGTVSATTGTGHDFTYTPAPGYVGPDSFQYVFLSNDASVSNTATVSITVTPTTPPPLTGAVDDFYTVAQDSPSIHLSPKISENDDPSAMAGKALILAPSGTHGDVDHGNGGLGDVTFKPEAGFSGQTTFEYAYGEPGSETPTSNVATVTITVTPTGGGGDAAADDAYTVPADESTLLTPDVTANDTGTGTVWAVGTNPSHGTVTTSLTDGHDYTYTPNPGYTGPDSFTYAFLDSSGQESNQATVTITVVGPDGPGIGDGDGDDDGDGDGDGRDKHDDHDGKLPDTGAPIAPTSLIAAWLLTAVGSYLIVRSRRRVA